MKKELKQYATLQSQIRDLELQRDALKEVIMDSLHKERLDKVESDYGKFTLSHRVSYTYSEKIEKMNERIKLAKVREEENGTAQERITEYLTFTPIKT